jgi:hypothetical protein
MKTLKQMTKDCKKHSYRTWTELNDDKRKVQSWSTNCNPVIPYTSTTDGSGLLILGIEGILNIWTKEKK